MQTKRTIAVRPPSLVLPPEAESLRRGNLMDGAMDGGVGPSRHLATGGRTSSLSSTLLAELHPEEIRGRPPLSLTARSAAPGDQMMVQQTDRPALRIGRQAPRLSSSQASAAARAPGSSHHHAHLRGEAAGVRKDPDLNRLSSPPRMTSPQAATLRQPPYLAGSQQLCYTYQ